MAGLTALAVLLPLETGFAILLMKQDLGTYLRGVASPAGLPGLAGQLMLAWLPTLTGLRAKATHTHFGLDQGKAHRPC